jgi:hypothetical protein
MRYMATENRTVHDWSTGQLVITEIEITDEEQVGELPEVNQPPEE